MAKYLTHVNSFNKQRQPGKDVPYWMRKQQQQQVKANATQKQKAE